MSPGGLSSNFSFLCDPQYDLRIRTYVGCKGRQKALLEILCEETRSRMTYGMTNVLFSFRPLCLEGSEERFQSLGR